LTAIVGLSRFTLLALLAAPAVLHPAPGGITPQEATALFKASAGAAMKELKDGLKITKQNFIEAFQAFEDSIDNGDSVFSAAVQLFDDCANNQGGVYDKATDAIDAIATGAGSALGSLANGTPLDGAFPKDFYAGTGGAYDKARRDVRTQVEKLYKSLEGRRKKIVKYAEKNGAALTVELRVPNYVDDYSFWDGAAASHANRFGLDIVVAVNHIGVEQDGRVWIGGSAESEIEDISGTVFGAVNEMDSGSTSPVSGRWDLTVFDGGTFFRRGNYIVNVRAEADGAAIGGVNFSLR
jgi:hypothetical protein